MLLVTSQPDQRVDLKFETPTREQIVSISAKHVAMMETSDADDTWIWVGMEHLLLHTIGRRSGKQHKVAVGDRIRVEKIAAGVGDKVTFDEVLALQTEGGLQVGRPVLKGARVVGRVVEQDKAKKELVFKKKKRKQYRRTRGHRQPFTAVVVEEIHAG